MLDLIGSIALGSLIAAALVGLLTAASLRASTKIGIAAFAGAWLGLAAAATAAGWLSRAIALLLFFVVPLLAVGVLSFAVPAFRRVLSELSPAVIIRINAIRVLGAFFLFLALADRLSGPFPYSAGIGDFITGILAFPVAAIAAREGVSHWRVVAWNAFGMLDLIAAVALGITSRNGSPIQLIHAGAGSAAIDTLPWSLVPLVLVPVYLIGHVIVFAHVGWMGVRRQGYAGSMT